MFSFSIVYSSQHENPTTIENGEGVGFISLPHSQRPFRHLLFPRWVVEVPLVKAAHGDFKAAIS